MNRDRRMAMVVALGLALLGVVPAAAGEGTADDQRGERGSGPVATSPPRPLQTEGGLLPGGWSVVRSTASPTRAGSRMLHLPVGSFDTRKPAPQIPAHLRLVASEGSRSGVPWIVQFREPLSRIDREALQDRGVRVYAYLPDNAYLVRGDDTAALADLPGAVWTAPFHPGYRMPQGVTEELDEAGEPLPMRLLLFDPADRGAVAAALAEAGAVLATTKLPADDVRLYFSGDVEAALVAARLDAVRRVELAPNVYQLHNAESRPVIQSGTVSGGAIYHEAGITGARQVVGMLDEGLDLDTLLLSDTDTAAGTASPTHRKVYDYSVVQRCELTLASCVIDGDCTPNLCTGGTCDVDSAVCTVDEDCASNLCVPGGDTETCACPEVHGSSHGTMVAQAIAGQEAVDDIAGTFSDLAGAAPGSRLYFKDALISDNFACTFEGLTMPVPLTDAYEEVRTGVAPPHEGYLWNGSFGIANGGYCDNARDSDDYLWDNRDFLLFFSAGNSRWSVGCPATAKNAMSVGGHYQDPFLDIYGAVNGASFVCDLTGRFCVTDADCAADTCVDSSCSITGGGCTIDADCSESPCIDPTLICQGTSTSCTSDADCGAGVPHLLRRRRRLRREHVRGHRVLLERRFLHQRRRLRGERVHEVVQPADHADDLGAGL